MATAPSPNANAGMKNPVIRIEIRDDAGGCRLVATFANGSDTCFGHMMTERGAKRMLTVRARQFGLVVTGSQAV